jgi:thiosulfate/3-mercaptopyruvate sulfurtransferase
MFRAMGHKDVAILDGGLPKWMAEGRPVTDDPTPPRERHFTARLDNTLVRSIDDVKELIDSKREQIVDARAAGRFRGEAPEPRAGLRSGHMPGAFNLPYNELLDPKTGTCAAGRSAQGAHRGLGHRPSKKVTASCGSGVTACVVGSRPLPHGRA